MLFLRGFAVAVLLCCSVVIDASLVRTDHGYVRGLRQRFRDNNNGKIKTVHKFLGVPYAQPPVGELRFKPPQAHERWEPAIHDAKAFKDVCMQGYQHYGNSINSAWPGFSEKKISEDCLYLNVYTPSLHPGAQRLPVIFYIHGGGFFAGSPIRDVSPGEFLPLQGVVLVAVQYRLGLFGFFSAGNSDAPGNVGLLDQVAALKWTQANIARFGGDPNNVTLLGESAGGSSVSLHLLSPLSKGLFQRVIAISGVEFSPFATLPKKVVINYGTTVAKAVGCTTESSLLMVKCLRSKPSKQLQPHWRFVKPIVDEYFLPDEPKTLRQEGLFHKVPLMSGFVTNEGSFLLENSKVNYSLEGLQQYIEWLLKGEVYRTHKLPDESVLDAVQFQYTPWGDTYDSARIREKIVELLSDFYVAAPTHASLSEHSKRGALTYMFEFTHRSQNHKKPRWMGVVHGDTTAYKFGVPLLTSQQNDFDAVDRNVSDMLVKMYVNFAKYGNPTPRPVYGANWEPYNTSTKAYLKIQETPIMAKQFHPARMAFWNAYFPRLIRPRHPAGPKIGEVKNAASIWHLQWSLLLVVKIAIYFLLLGD